MAQPPKCKAMGRQCTALPVVLKIGRIADDSPASLDALATWLLGHTERLSFGRPFDRDGELLVRATIHVSCKYLEQRRGSARCTAHGYESAPVVPEERTPRERKLGGDIFEIVTDRRLAAVPLKRPRGSLPILGVVANPCVGAPCRTADQKRGAACCRDLGVAIRLPERARYREALIRSRKSPYVCKVERTGPTTVEAEVISACSFLEGDAISCALHGRKRPNGRVAKPWLCTRWPRDAEVTHPGCRLVDRSA